MCKGDGQCPTRRPLSKEPGPDGRGVSGGGEQTACWHKADRDSSDVADADEEGQRGAGVASGTGGS